MQFITIKDEFRCELIIDAHFDHAFVDGGAGSGGTLVIHGSDGLLLTGFFVLFKNNDLGILTTQLNDGSNIRM